MGLALMVPFQVMLMMQMRYHPTYYRPRLIRFSMMTGACGLGWFASNQSQKQNLDSLSAKYFANLSDEELLSYDRTQADILAAQ